MKTTVTVKRRTYNNPITMMNEAEYRSVKEALEYGAYLARRYVPVRSGYLKSSIAVLSRDSFGATADYAGFVELGTKHMSAQPYIEPATREMVKKLPALYVANFRG